MHYLITNPFADLFTQVMVVLHDFSARLPLPEAISPYAIAIVLIAVLVKLVTYPLTLSQTRSMKSMQAIQPKLTELQTRLKDDREKLAQAQMELFRENKVNPLGGCWPLVVQMVVLIGLYQAINDLASAGKLAGEPFLWVPDLGKCEPSPFCGKDLGLLPGPLPILVILLLVTQLWYQQVLTPATTSSDPQQRAMNTSMKLMPFIFTSVFISLPAGLVLYYTLFNVVSALMQMVTNRQIGVIALSTPVQTSTLPSEGTPTNGSATKEKTENGQSNRRIRRRKPR